MSSAATESFFAASDGVFCLSPPCISAPEGCGRFAGRVIRNVDAAAPTPAWMRERLERAGQRSISALVDVTNYVMLELGRPLHVYDLDKLRGAIDVRWGRAGEKVLLLNGQTVDVDPSVLCITDESGPIGLAGIMGGETTKAETTTRNLFLESAFFFPEAIAGRARRYNFTSDASHRFERGVDFDNNAAGIEYATRLVLDICGGEPGPAGRPPPCPAGGSLPHGTSCGTSRPCSRRMPPYSPQASRTPHPSISPCSASTPQPSRAARTSSRTSCSTRPTAPSW